MNDLKEYITLLCLCLGGCTSMQWEVNDQTTVQNLNNRYHEEVANLWQCAEMDYDWLVDCPEYHRVWRRYWDARRELASRGKRP